MRIEKDMAYQLGYGPSSLGQRNGQGFTKETESAGAGAGRSEWRQAQSDCGALCFTHLAACRGTVSLTR